MSRAHSPTLLLLHLHHSSFSNPSFASPTSQALHLIHLASSPCSNRYIVHLRPEFNFNTFRNTYVENLHCAVDSEFVRRTGMLGLATPCRLSTGVSYVSAPEFTFSHISQLSHIQHTYSTNTSARKAAALAQMVECLPLVQRIRGSIPSQIVHFHLKIVNLGARRGEHVHFLIARLYITGLD